MPSGPGPSTAMNPCLLKTLSFHTSCPWKVFLHIDCEVISPLIHSFRYILFVLFVRSFSSSEKTRLTLFTTRPCGLLFSWWGCYGLCHRHKLTKLAHSFLFCSCVCFCLYGPFNSTSFHTFSRQRFAFSLCSFGLNSAFLVLSPIYLFTKVSLSPDVIFCG